MLDEKEEKEDIIENAENTGEVDGQGESESSTEDRSPPKKKSLFLIILIIALLCILSAAAAAYFFFFTETPAPQKSQAIAEYNPTYFPLPDLKLRMRYVDKSIGYMVIGLTLRIPEDSTPEEYKQKEPEILDTLHTFIGSLNLDEFTPVSFNRFTPPVGLERVRQNILIRLNTVLAPLKVEAILFRKLITQ